MTRTPPTRRRGLTFIELMFATIILGVGMIIIASVFPVAISQQRQTLDEGSIASLERGAVRALEARVTVGHGTAVTPLPLPLTPVGIVDTAMPANNTGGINSFDTSATPALWDFVKGDLVNAGDPRYAFSPLYMRLTEGTDASRVTFFVVTLASKDAAAFDGSSEDDLAKLKPSSVKITYYFKDDPTAGNRYDSSSLPNDPEQDTIKVEAGSGLVPNTVFAAVTGGYVIRAANVKPGSLGTPNPLFPQNAVIKLGSQFEGEEINSSVDNNTTRVFRVAPGFELNRGDTGPVSAVPAYAVGADPYDATKKANRAISCRGVTVKLLPPG